MYFVNRIFLVVFMFKLVGLKPIISNSKVSITTFKPINRKMSSKNLVLNATGQHSGTVIFMHGLV